MEVRINGVPQTEILPVTTTENSQTMQDAVFSRAIGKAFLIKIINPQTKFDDC